MAKSLGASQLASVILPQIVGGQANKEMSLKSGKVVPGGNKLNLKASLVQNTGRGQQASIND